MRLPRNNRGTAILMVVGLLTVLAMLGSAFLVAAYLDRQRSRAMASRSQSDPAVEGFVSWLRSRFADDLYMSAGRTGPYWDPLAYASGPTGWTRRIDALTTLDPNFPESWLSPFFYSQGGASVGWADTDGDGSSVNDALLYPTGLYNSNGDQYFIAAKMTDLSSRLGVSTAGNPDPNFHSVKTRSPSAVSLPQRLGWAGYAWLQGYRSNVPNPVGAQGPLSLSNYDVSCGRRLFQPTDPNVYLPYAIGDEMYLRWLGTNNAPTQAGRLWQALSSFAGGTDPARRQTLTTYNESRNAAPRPATSMGTWPYDQDFTVRIDPNVRPGYGNDPISVAARQATYRRANIMLERLGVGSANARKRMAAAFVANLWAYQTADAAAPHPDNGADAPWEFTPEPGITAYGLVQRLVITEAYAAHMRPVDPNDPEYAWACAIEIFNPSDKTIDLGDYVLDADGNGQPMPSVAISSGQRVVLHRYYDNLASPKITEANLGLVPVAGSWFPSPTLTFLDSTTMRLKRRYATADIPADQVSATNDLGYAYSDTGFARDGILHSVDIRRDDNPDRARYNIAVYERFATPGTAAGTHRLGLTNNLGGSTPTIDATAMCGAPINRSGTALNDLGELSLIHLGGPWKDANADSFHCFPSMMANDAGLSSLLDRVARSRGRLDPAPYIVGFGGYSPVDYPDVPIGCLLSQFFSLVPGDAYRGDLVPTRVYGRINVNTAPATVLACLPLPAQIATPAGIKNVDANVAAEYIAAYRDHRAVCIPNTGIVDTAAGPGPGRNYGVSRAIETNIVGLRVSSQTLSVYLTPDEIAIPLADYANRLMEWTDYSPGAGGGKEPVASGGLLLSQHKDYVVARDSLWRAVSNLVSVTTDVVAANVYVQMGPTTITNPLGKYHWNYVVVVDRSNCNAPGNLPAVILFSEVK